MSLISTLKINEQYSTIYKDTRKLVAQAVASVVALSKGNKPQVNDTKTFNNGVKIVPTFALTPVIVTKGNAVATYSGDPILDPIIKGK